MSVELDVKKLKKQIEKVSKEFNGTKITPIILILGGSFSPVHKMHVESLVVSKKYIDCKDKKVVAGYLVPSSDFYVKGKLKNDALSLDDRNLLIDYSIEDSDFIMNCNWGVANSEYAGIDMMKIIEKEVPLDAEKFNPYVKYFICGADFALRAPLSPNNHYVIMGRGESTKMLKEYVPKVIERNTFIEDESIYDLSSSQIRNKLKNNESLSNEMYPKALEYFLKITKDKKWNETPSKEEKQKTEATTSFSSKYLFVLLIPILGFIILKFNKF